MDEVIIFLEVFGVFVDILLRVGVPLACALVTFGVTMLVSWLKSKTKSKKLKSALDSFQTAVEDIAVTVEQLFDGSGSEQKRAAFEEICAKKGLNVADAVAYLEKHIIPTSKSVNIVDFAVDDDDVTTD